MIEWLGVIGSLLALILGIFTYFKRQNRDRRKRAEEASKVLKKGVDEKDPSQITSSFDRLRNS